MPIELRTQRDGKLRKFWYGRFELNGHRHYLNLGVKILGTPPGSLSLREEGDPAFERSRAAAQANPDGITVRVRRVLAATGFRDPDEGKDGAGGAEPTTDGPAGRRVFRGEIHAERKEGLRRASIRNFHSFRVTWSP